MKLFLQKNTKFSSAGGSAPRPPCLRRLESEPPDPRNSPPLRISSYASGSHKGYVLFVCCRPASNSAQKIGLSLSEDFFFALHLILGKNLDWIWVQQFLILMFVLKIFWSFCPPLFKILRTLLVLCIMSKLKCLFSFIYCITAPISSV